MKLKVGNAVYLLGGIIIAGILAAATVATIVVSNIRVGGPLYGQIALGKDLVADILPPPAYVIEAYLESALALRQTTTLSQVRAKLKTLKESYSERQAFWQTAAIPDEIKAKFNGRAHASAQIFWGVVEQELLPALERKAQADADAAFVKASQAYDAHRKGIDEIVVDANKFNADLEAAAERASRSTLIWMTAAIILLLSTVLASVIIFSRLVINPIVRLTGKLGQVSAGETGVEIDSLNRTDEIGDMARALNAFKSAMSGLQSAEEAAEQRRLADEERERNEQERRRNEEERQRNAVLQAKAAEEQTQAMNALARGLHHLRDGDLMARLDAGFAAEYSQIRDDFNETISRLRESISAIKASTLEVSNASAEISASTTDLSQRTEEQAASLEETSASMEEMAATVKKNAENAQAANQSADGAHVVADRGGQVVAEAVQAMARIEESSRKISDIIGVIDEIARQTNLLALNAAVEAARAGEAGRGFAVVASEVRSLAQRSSQAAKDIKDLIVSSNGQVKDGVNLVNRAGGSLAEIVESIKSVAAIVSDIASASAEQAVGIAEVNKALTQMDEATQQNSALVEENAATAKTLEQQARAMDERVNFFRLGDGVATITRRAA